MVYKHDIISTFKCNIKKFDSLKWTLIISFIARIILLNYGIWQDNTMAIKYTDVDYYVFTDAAKLITEVVLYNIYNVYINRF